MVTFSLIHASRGRAIKALSAAREWLSKASKENQLQYILSLDEDDAPNYKETISELKSIANVIVSINNNAHMVEAVNVAALLADGDILIFVADDLGCPDGWDTLLLKRLDPSPFKLGDVFCFFVTDGVCDPYVCQTHPFMSRSLYQKLGYMYYPEYISICADADFTAVMKRLNCIVNATDITFEHRHPNVGKAPWDATYAKENSDAAHYRARVVFERRTAAGFGFPPLT